MKQVKIRELENKIMREYGNTTGIVVHKNGEKVYEQYFQGFSAGDAVHLFSVTKSVMSALYGIALDEGHINSLDQNVLDFFPNYTVKANEKIIQSITIKDLLSMKAPYKYEAEPYAEFFESENWVKTALDYLGGEKYTGEFHYSAIIGTHILSGILTQATGLSIIEFAREKLFTPLGIHIKGNVIFHSAQEQMAWYAKDKHAAGWVVDPQGINTASWGLSLSPGDLAKIGQLYLNDGLHGDRRILSCDWIADSTSAKSRWGELLYAYLWWVFEGAAGRSYAAMGDGGNVLYVNPQKKMVVAVTALFMPEARDRMGLIVDEIEPLFD